MFVGTVVSERIVPYAYDKRYKTFDLRVVRKNGDVDIFPVIVEESRDVEIVKQGEKIRFKGFLQSHWATEEGAMTAVFAGKITPAGTAIDIATVSISGVVTKMVYASYGKIGSVQSFTLKTRRLPQESPSLVYAKSYGDLADAITAKFKQGMHVIVVGRVQSRSFKKSGQLRRAVEVSVTQYEIRENA